MTFQEWFNSEPHRAKYTNYHPAYLAAQEAWEAAHEACAQFLESTQLGSLPDDTALHYARLLKGFAEGIRARLKL